MLDSKTILTAAHCLDSPTEDYSKWTIRAGDRDKRKGQKVQIAEVINYPSYSEGRMPNDISIIKLAEHLTLGDTVQAICLPPSWDFDYQLLDGDDCYASGWGLIHKGKSIPILLT